MCVAANGSIGMSAQLDIFGSQPQFKGETFSPERDGKRLQEQLGRVRRLMQDGRWRTLANISAATGDPEASVSARLRQLRKEPYSMNVERCYVYNGIWKYRVAP